MEFPGLLAVWPYPVMEPGSSSSCPGLLLKKVVKNILLYAMIPDTGLIQHFCVIWVFVLYDASSYDRETGADPA